MPALGLLTTNTSACTHTHKHTHAHTHTDTHAHRRERQAYCKCLFNATKVFFAQLLCRVSSVNPFTADTHAHRRERQAYCKCLFNATKVFFAQLLCRVSSVNPFTADDVHVTAKNLATHPASRWGPWQIGQPTCQHCVQPPDRTVGRLDDQSADISSSLQTEHGADWMTNLPTFRPASAYCPTILQTSCPF